MWGIGPKNMFDIGSGNCISIELTELELLCYQNGSKWDGEKKLRLNDFWMFKKDKKSQIG